MLASLCSESRAMLVSLKSQVHPADDYSCHGQSRSRNVRVDQLVQIMQQEAPLVGQHATLAFEPVLQQSQRTGREGRNSIRIPRTREAMCSQRRSGRERVRNAPKITQAMKSACRKRRLLNFMPSRCPRPVESAGYVSGVAV